MTDDLTKLRQASLDVERRLTGDTIVGIHKGKPATHLLG
jgi:hypothetical protein